MRRLKACNAWSLGREIGEFQAMRDIQAELAPSADPRMTPAGGSELTTQWQSVARRAGLIEGNNKYGQSGKLTTPSRVRRSNWASPPHSAARLNCHRARLSKDDAGGSQKCRWASDCTFAVLSSPPRSVLADAAHGMSRDSKCKAGLKCRAKKNLRGVPSAIACAVPRARRQSAILPNPHPRRPLLPLRRRDQVRTLVCARFTHSL